MILQMTLNMDLYEKVQNNMPHKVDYVLYQILELYDVLDILRDMQSETYRFYTVRKEKISLRQNSFV